MIVIGCDPGSTGALYELRRGPTGVWTPGDYLRMPFVATGKRIQDLNIPEVADWLAVRAAQIGLVVLEQVGYMPAKKFGEKERSGFGDAILAGRVAELRGMVKALKYPHTSVAPTAWQGALKIKIPRITGEDRDARKKRIKAAVAAFCTQRYPTACLIPPGCKVVQDGLADALAMAHYGVTQLAATMAPAGAPA